LILLFYQATAIDQHARTFVDVPEPSWGGQVLAALFVLVPFCYISGAFVISPVVEESSQAHHLQLLSGAPPIIYWAGHYVSLCHHAPSQPSACGPMRMMCCTASKER
jgi:hypothetical protein